MSTPAELRARAAAQIQANGSPFQLTRTPKTYSTSTSEAASGTPQVWNSYAADWEFSRLNAEAAMIRHDDVRLIAAAQDLTDPEPDDTATYSSVTYRVVTARPIRKAGVSIAYDVHLTKR